MSCGIVIENDTVRDLSGFDARLLGKIDIQRIGIGIIIELHGLNPLSGKALCIVTLSSRVITLNIRPSSSSIRPQNRYRFPS